MPAPSLMALLRRPTVSRSPPPLPPPQVRGFALAAPSPASIRPLFSAQGFLLPTGAAFRFCRATFFPRGLPSLPASAFLGSSLGSPLPPWPVPTLGWGQWRKAPRRWHLSSERLQHCTSQRAIPGVPFVRVLSK